MASETNHQSRLPHFNTPAYWAEKDFAGDPSGLKEFQSLWNDYLSIVTQTSIQGNPFTNKYDSPRKFYFNPLESEYPTPSSMNTVPIKWGAYPNRILHYFAQKFSEWFPKDPREKLNELADIGPKEFEVKYGRKLVVPRNPCDPNDKKTIDFGPGGPRGWEDEYCEWAVARNTNATYSDGMKKITKVMFTHENPEYYFNLWRVDPNLVHKLYKDLLQKTDSELPIEDLYLRDKAGQPVIVRETGKPAYNPINKWNSGSKATSTGGGAIHLTSPPNSLGAEDYLGAAATILRKDEAGNPVTTANSLICCSRYGQIFRNSDPLIGQRVNNLVRKKKLFITLTNPVGLYGQEPNWDLFELPANAPSGAHPKDYWKVTRGYLKSPNGCDFYPGNMILHHTYEVPEDHGFTVGDIKINGKEIRWGSQIADTFHVQLAGTGKPSGQTPIALPCVKKGKLSEPYANPWYLLDSNLLQASLDANLPSLSNVTTVITEVERGKTTHSLSVLASNCDENSQLNFGPGITSKIVKRHDLEDGVYLMEFEVEVVAGAELRYTGLAISNKEHADGIFAPGFLKVVEKGSLHTSSSQIALNLEQSHFDLLKSLIKS